MTKIPILIAAFTGLASQAAAQPLSFEGAWAQNPETCGATHTDLVPMQISSDAIRFYESKCALTNPVSIREMNGQLFDLVCTGEGEEWSVRGLLLLNTDGSLTYASNGQTTVLQRCE